MKTIKERIKTQLEKIPILFRIMQIRLIKKREILDKKYLKQWQEKDKKGPSPHFIKRQTVKEFSKKYSLETLVETGTYLGEMIWATKNNFKEIHSIELNENLYKRSKRLFSNNKNINLHLGDSGEILQKILKEIKKPCLFWLDAHYSSGITARGNLDTPIIKELEIILNSPVKNHVILIDDARCFIGENDYPTLNELESFIKEKSSYTKFEVKDDIIRIYNK
ncbi:hypothetical protein KKC45_03435 [Patescibacteria group bacterium]|nr:hypothetical protein [Patescibacteria group bacterium]